MLKQKVYNIADSNIANLGTDLEKKVKAAAANKEPAWDNAGKSVGLQIWRIEKFHVVSWPKEDYGTFYTGDSYIVLNTYKKKGGDQLLFDVHFWLGKYTTQDEAGTAAYKTVELDDKLGGAPVQHREVQGWESELFLSYFKNEIRLLDGGVETGFRHVEPDKYRPRLLWIKGRKKVRVTEVELSFKSLNSGDVFILDAGMILHQWNGKKAGLQEKTKGAQIARAIDDERKGQPKIIVNEDGHEEADFWKLLGGKGEVKAAAEGGPDDEENKGEKKLFRLSDASGKLEFKEVASGNAVKRSLLDSKDVFVLDTGAEIFAWIGKGASVAEKQKALSYAQDYLTKFNRPVYLPIARVFEGGENEVFEAALH
jgi:gelsolin